MARAMIQLRQRWERVGEVGVGRVGVVGAVDCALAFWSVGLLGELLPAEVAQRGTWLAPTLLV